MLCFLHTLLTVTQKMIYCSSGSGWYLSVLFLASVHFLGADYTLEIQLEEYENTLNTAENGFCCEREGGGCTHNCDSRFLFCLRPAGFDQSSEDCPLGSYSTGVIGGDMIIFPIGELDGGVQNPLVFNGTTWTGSVQLYIRVDDDDSMSPPPGPSPPMSSDDPEDDLVTKIYIEQSVAVSSTFSSSGTLSGSNMNTFIKMSQRVLCVENFFGSDCATFCDDDLGQYTCGSNGERICNGNYYGPNCTVFCDDDLGPYTCGSNGERICNDNYYGPNCTIFCEERDDAQGHYTCDDEGNIMCREGYNDTSTNCTECIPAVGCSPVGGFCREGNECLCHPDYTGDLCESDLNVCRQTTLCQNGGTCTNIGPDMYNCSCAEGFEGVNCELTVTDECAPDPCQNGATCMDLFMNYTCECVDGYEGNNCEIDINECDSNPCQNGGSCTDLVAGYNCTCAEGYEGEDCSQETDECINQLEPCRNGATCIDLFLNYTCECADGYEGRDCGVEIDECDSNPCQNGGNCTDLVADYSCSCPPGLGGRNCEREEGAESSSSGVDVGVVVGAVVAGVLLVLIVILMVVLVLVLRRKRKQVISESSKVRPSVAVTNAVFHSESHEHPGAIPLDILAKEKTETGSSSDHKFNNPIYGSREHEPFYAQPKVTPALGVYYPSVGGSSKEGPDQYDRLKFQCKKGTHPYATVKTEGGKPVDQQEPIRNNDYVESPPPESTTQVHLYDYAESAVSKGKDQVNVVEEYDVIADVEPHIYNILEDPREMNAPVHKYDYIENQQMEPPHDYDYADMPSKPIHSQTAIRSSWPYEIGPEAQNTHEQHYEFGPEAQNAHEQHYEFGPEAQNAHEQHYEFGPEAQNTHEQHYEFGPEAQNTHEQHYEFGPEAQNAHEQHYELGPEAQNTHEQHYEFGPNQ